MPKINVNFDEVPDKMEPVPAGVYVMLVKEAEIQPTKDGKSEKVVVTLSVDDESSPHNGRMVFDHISLKMPINLKQLAKSAGLNPGADGLEVSDLVGKHVKVRVKARAYRDAETGETRETSAVAEYMWE